MAKKEPIHSGIVASTMYLELGRNLRHEGNVQEASWNEGYGEKLLRQYVTKRRADQMMTLWEGSISANAMELWKEANLLPKKYR